jgi:hypothetical protein
MNVKLTPHSESLLREYLKRGEYRSPAEIIERALETLGEQQLTRRQGAWVAPESSTSVLHLQGLGKEIWQNIDAQNYVNEERAVWNE